RYGEAGFEAMRRLGLRGILFQETQFAPDNADAKAEFEKLTEKFSTLKENETDRVKIGISPHAPYTVSRDLFEKITDFAIAEDVMLTIHAAESEEEKNLMVNGSGFFASIYKREKINWEVPRMGTIEYLNKIGVLKAKPLLAHCVKISANDIDLIAQSGSTIAHCPKSNAKFGHGVAPFEQILRKNIAVGLGSDSMASNNTCNILEEARFASLIARTTEFKKRFIHAEEVVSAATIGGAKAMGMQDKIGTLEKGKYADIIAVSLDEVFQKPVHDIYSALLFATNSNQVVFTMVAGEEIYRHGRNSKIDEDALINEINEITRKMNSDF
ncbi:MAG: amidohydrolase family protein, partial [Pyrinomonadaceae bacterium]|nr:amidohydrolase family protein [Pyrinomonadaceae bacterium]